MFQRIPGPELGWTQGFPRPRHWCDPGIEGPGRKAQLSGWVLAQSCCLPGVSMEVGDGVTVLSSHTPPLSDPGAFSSSFLGTLLHTSSSSPCHLQLTLSFT